MPPFSIYVSNEHIAPFIEVSRSIRYGGLKRFLEDNIKSISERAGIDRILDTYVTNFCCINDQIYKKASNIGNSPTDPFMQKSMNAVYSANRASSITLEKLALEKEDYIAVHNENMMDAFNEEFIPNISSLNRVVSKKTLSYFCTRYHDPKRGNGVKQAIEFLTDIEKTSSNKIRELKLVSDYMKFLDEIRIFGDSSKEYIFRRDRIFSNGNAEDNAYDIKHEFAIRRVKSEVKFSDIAGLEFQKRQIDMFAQPLKYPEVYVRNNSREFSGLLFYGPPGTGKTMLAKAMANGLDIDFIYIKVSDITSKFFGDSEKIIQSYFDEAKKNGRTILFFDELDGIAPKRGGIFNSSATDRIVSTMLVNLDGIIENKNIIPLGATNRIDSIDPALIRPGRFSKLIYVPLPDKEAREQILRLKIENASRISRMLSGDGIFKNFSKEGLDRIVDASEGMSGADINEILERVKEDKTYEECKFKNRYLIDENQIMEKIKDYERKNTQSPS